MLEAQRLVGPVDRLGRRRRDRRPFGGVARPLRGSGIPGAKPTIGAPIGTRYFRRTVSLPEGRRVRKASLVADGRRFVCRVRQRPTRWARGQSWAEVKLFDVTGAASAGAQRRSPSPPRIALAERRTRQEPRGADRAPKVEFDDGRAAPDPDRRALAHQRDGGCRLGERRLRRCRMERGPATRGCSARPRGARSAGRTTAGCPRGCSATSSRSPKRLRRATAYVCGLGFFDLHLNGQTIGDQLMNPALTGYDRRALYVTFDVTRDVHPGDNAVGVVLGNGRYFAPRRDVPVPMTTYGFPKLLLPDSPGVSPTARWRTWSATPTGG